MGEALPRRERPVAVEPLLSVRKVTKRFGGLVAVKDANFELREGEILGLIGPNGAGKSTLFNLITGMAPVSGGQIFFTGERIELATAISGHAARYCKDVSAHTA